MVRDSRSAGGFARFYLGPITSLLDAMKYFLLELFWIIWCTVHSALICLPVTQWLRRRFPSGYRYYRILYNLLAASTLLPLLFYTNSLRGTSVVAWHGLWQVVPIVLGATALFLFVTGARRYDFLQFLGLRQIKYEETCSVLTEDCSLDSGGVLAMVRHPWYSGGILIIWARPLDVATILTNMVICGYFVAGAFLEERKLKIQFGQEYIKYQQRVSMFFPVKWIKGLFFAA
jgi:protein-S-isoprenylcysteine O-methyltransferase Ste14